ncbi:hypothetical protein [Chroococcidiopsis sp. TS-821]|uniref:hypothetical protein n=1 Tax=Chroococcidiopsis sp. TS-821 TaxID=1378066 RepID=UPI0011B0AE2C|nr:hypothetical protein [Chroococcidiopsis sp. TS-821]
MIDVIDFYKYFHNLINEGSGVIWEQREQRGRGYLGAEGQRGRGSRGYLGAEEAEVIWEQREQRLSGSRGSRGYLGAEEAEVIWEQREQRGRGAEEAEGNTVFYLYS